MPKKRVYFAIDVADAKAKCRCWLLIRSFYCFQAVPSPRMAPTGNARHQKPSISGEGPSYPQKILFGQVEPKVVTRLVLEKETGVEEEVLEMGGDFP